MKTQQQARGNEWHKNEERGIEILRCGAKRLPSTFVDEEQGSNTSIIFVREGGHRASAPHSAGFQSHASYSHASYSHASCYALALLMLCLVFVFGLPGYAQTSAPPVTISGPPDVLVIVYQQPGGADQVDITYAGAVPHAQALRDYQALTQAAGWPVSTHSIKDASAPMQSHSGPMTSIVFQALGVVQDATHTFPIQTFAQAFRAYKRINVVFFAGPQFQFQGPRFYADTDIRMTLDQQGTTYVYALQILNSQMTGLPPLGTVPPAVTAGHRSIGLLLLGILSAAALAGLAVYWLTARLTLKTLPEDDSVGTDSRIEVGTK